MRYIFKFPDLGEGLDEGTIMEWYVYKGQEIKSGDPLANMETDKVVTDIPSPKSGTIVSLFGNVGDVIKVGEAMVEIEIPGIDGEEIVNGSLDDEKPQVEDQEVVVGTFDIAGNHAYLPASKEGVDAAGKKNKKKKVIATPVARALAAELGIDIREVPGMGPGGRIMKDDIVTWKEKISNKTEPLYPISDNGGQQVEYEPLSQIRKTIAKNMIRSKHNAAHMSAFEEVDASELIRLRSNYKDKFKAAGVRLSYLPFILKATAMALKKHKGLNAEMDLDNNRMIYKKQYNIGIAVDTHDGLIVPVIRDVDHLSIFELAQKLNEIAMKTRDRRISLEDLKDGTFTVTNFGSIGGMWASPLINYPQSAILGIGRIVTKPVIKNDEIVKGNVLPLSLSVDHRIIDGGEASRFLNQLMEYLGDPASLIID